MPMPAPLGHQSSGSPIALVFYGETNESKDIWVLEVLPRLHFPL